MGSGLDGGKIFVQHISKIFVKVVPPVFGPFAGLITALLLIQILSDAVT